ncbi:glucose-1-phosphate adenylyltransferase [Caldisalinibacter kiritimatiensis]|uniref:Glucose-1-phosphate adenylyltransferase n=1 Tax=Caldisalinibacter kiritimatiensis TaxID=1304284 RepID=R1CVD1_9FIRM|nr:glucose-1-phosphate adenylyltransferase [Caldisalinibacter kiritimatiensis]EOD00599.1 Glucose-1-phosphate adenylyltransferase [Caldisalinibacter kiritimatiensis]
MKNQKKEIIAMLLAGGQGTRLYPLTKKLAKPAVPFGGKYRIIDFALSNCANSDIHTVGVLTQYNPLVLNAHMGIGSPWDLDRRDGGLTILQPYVSQGGGRWYKGTANAIYENMHFIESYDPDYVLILSGDHIYKMDYSLLLDYHKEKKADVTISVIEVPWKEASRFGVMDINNNYRIKEFQEKPEKPKSNLASMGIYIFNWKVLKEYLIKDEKNPDSSNDFGKDIIPNMLEDGLNAYAYVFEGYWRDVGTIESFWEANMDLLSKDNKLNLYDRKWKIYTKNPVRPPHHICCNAKVKSSLLNEGCIIYGEIINSVLFPGVCVGRNSKIIDSVIMPNVNIQDNVVIEKAIVMSNTVIKAGSRIGSKNANDITVVTNEND